MKTVSKRLEAHFVACAVVAAAAAAGGADAAIVYSGIRNIAIPANVDGVYLNLITGATGTSGASVTGWHINPYSASNTSPATIRLGTNFPTPDVYFVGNGSNSSGGSAVNLTVGSSIAFDGTTVNNASSMNSAYKWSFSTASAVFGTSTGQWKVNADNYVGIVSLEGDGSVLMAWMRIAVGATAATRTIVDWGYEINGNALVVGAIPAPGALALLGVAGLVGARRRR
jgi:hypothetical protein